jgi:hypothetical protein
MLMLIQVMQVKAVTLNRALFAAYCVQFFLILLGFE